jgi:organic radical activating enzyme
MTFVDYRREGKGFEAAELLTTGFCPLNCKYCYIPKTLVMKELHQEIIQKLKDGSYLDNLERVVGNKVRYLAFWGTEPSLTLDVIQEKLPEIHKRFPLLEEVSFSTSMLFPDPVESFARALSHYDIGLKIQISLDGPSFITDKNRFEGAAKKVPDNFLKLVTNIQDISTHVNFSWKSTFTLENIKETTDNSKIREFFEYFETLNKKFGEINKNKNINLAKRSYYPTLAVPGKYTSEEGKIFARFLKKLHRKNHHTAYTPRLSKLFNLQEELTYKKRMFTCSGGDSQVGIGSRAHICHRSFYLDDERYTKSVLKQSEIENWDVSLFRKGSIDLLKKWYIPKVNDRKGEIRFRYLMRNYHDFWRFQMAYVKAIMTELALAGQAEKRFLDDEGYLTIFSLFVNTSLSCPMEAILNTGSIYLTPISLLRIFGNGAFREIFNDFQKTYQKREVRAKNNKDDSSSQKEDFPQQKEIHSSDSNLSSKEIFKKNKNSRIYFYNLSVGSGIERAGNTFLGMLNDYKKKHPENIREYKHQNPSSILVDDLINFNPEVIIMNEYYPRLIEACYYYKKFKQGTKIILLNHCYNNLTAPSIFRESSDAEITVNRALKEAIDYIINLNYHPEDKLYPSFLKSKVIDMYFTLKDDTWNIKIPFLERKKDFLYAGNLLPHKFSPLFVNEFSKTDMKIDIYGKMFKERKDLENYNNKILASSNFNYLGYVSPEKMPKIYNNYKFLILPHNGYEPFSFVVLEALKTGMIILFNDSKTGQRGKWISWADGLYIEDDTIAKLLARMKQYSSFKKGSKAIRELSERSAFVSKEVSSRTSYAKFREKFLQIIFN